MIQLRLSNGNSYFFVIKTSHGSDFRRKGNERSSYIREKELVMREVNTRRSSRPPRPGRARLGSFVAVVCPHPASRQIRWPAGRTTYYSDLLACPFASSHFTFLPSRASPPPSPTISPLRLGRDGAEARLVGPRHRRRLRYR